MPRLASLHVYPLKAARGLSPADWEVDDFGLKYDRRWAVVGADGVCITQREHPRLALVVPAIDGDTLRLSAPEMEPLELPIAPAAGAIVESTVWDDCVRALAPEPTADAWMSRVLGTACRLVHMPDASFRAAERSSEGMHGRVSFADAYPFLVLSEASLADLNARLAEPVPMNRFRPNLVVTDCAPFAEDGWRRLRVGPIELEVTKPCARCVVTTVNQATAVKGVEPLRTLATYRRRDGEAHFGQNAVHRGRGRLRAGTEIELL